MGSSENPVPLWGTIMIGIAGGLFLLCCVILICKNCCCKRKDTYASGRIGYMDMNAQQDTIDSKVQPELESVPIFNEDSFGKLQFALEYDKHVEELEVTVIQANRLRGTATHLLDSLLNCFVRVYISPDLKKIFDTDVVRMTSSPVYSKTFIFKLPYQSRHKKTLVFGIYHDAFLAEPVKVGQLRVPLGAYDLAHRVEEWHDLHRPEEEEKDTNLGEICISLRYVPTSGRLTVVVLEAKGLKELHKESKEYYVKLSFVLKKKTLRRRKTTSKQSTCNPYYNESFIFDASLDVLQEAYLKVVVAVPRSSPFGGRSVPVGCLTLGAGSKASTSASNHWSEVLGNVGRPFVHWHTLLPVASN